MGASHRAGFGSLSPPHPHVGLQVLLLAGPGTQLLSRLLVKIAIPDELWDAREILNPSALNPAWAAIPSGMASVEHGSAWIRSSRSLLLLVPSVIVPEESVVLINPAHADAQRLSATNRRAFEYDRLFRR
ncbi:MAG: hypothetical protein KGL42_16710 [Betaproteobacteria bacterium]|nr:hypothetical protein [Betaproteobacteria bacterium]